MFLGGELVALPPSKKTRALLAYLVITGREQRRSRLCSLFWDVADDPRGALRWSLSKLRKVLNQPHCERLVTTRDMVAFVTENTTVDLFELRRAVAAGGGGIERLREVAGAVRGELLEGLDLNDFDDFQAWCVAEREEARRQHAALLRRLSDELEPEQAIPYAQRLTRVEPLDEEARARLLFLLSTTGRVREAEQQYKAAKRLFAELGMAKATLLQDAREALDQAASRPPLPMPEPEAPPPSTVAPHLVGRRRELDALRAALDRVAGEGRQHVMLLTGEPGVGKSRLLTELMGWARGRGGTVLAGAAYEAEGDRPYGPFIDALRATPRHQMGESIGNHLAALLPELAGETPTDPSRDRMFGAVVELVAARAHSAPPVLLILDDLHWCDEASSGLLHYVVRMNRHRPLLVVLAARDGELPDNDAATRVLRSLRREHGLEELAVGPLSREDTVALVQTLAPPGVAERVHAESAGNPLFALELARSGRHAGALPPTLTDVIRDRIDRLAPEAADVLRWSAVLGQHFGVARLAELTVLDPMTLTAALETLERHALLVVNDTTGDAMGAYRFAHDIVHRVVYGELSAPRRRLMHQRIAASLQASGDADESLATEVARHASLGGDAAMATRACVAAGRRCLRLFAPAEAYNLARRGMRYADDLPEPERTERKLELIEVSYAARRPEQPDEAAAELETLAERALDHGKMHHARLGFHVLSYLRWEGGDWQEAKRGMLQAEVMTRGQDDDQRVEALAEAARCLLLLDRDHHQAEAMSLEAQALSLRLGVEAATVDDSAGMLDLHRGAVEEARAHFERARALARRKRDRFGEYQALEHLVTVEIEEGRFAEARGYCDELVALGCKFREGSEEPYARALCAICRVTTNEPRADRDLDDALEALRNVDAKHRLAFTLNRAAAIDLEKNHEERAHRRADEALALATLLGHKSEALMARVVLAKSHAARGEHEAAAQHRAELRGASLAGVAMPVRHAVEELLAPTSGEPHAMKSP